MNLFGKNLHKEVAVIAEIGVNHEGDPEVASSLLALAADAGADAVKFQSFTPERYASASDAERLKRVTGLALDEATHRRLAKEAKEKNIVFFSTPVTEDWVPLIAELSPAIKIASGDLTFEPVIRASAATGRIIILSTGLGTLEEIDQAVEWIRDEIGSASLIDRLVLMHCVSAYPAPIDEANILSVPFLKERYGLVTGYSNHVIGVDACIAAVALGAQVIEVHFTDCKTGRDFRDHELSMEADDLKVLLNRIANTRASLGSFGKERQPCELANLNAVRKGVVAAQDMEAGVVLAESNLMYARPAIHFPAKALSDLIGRTLTTPLRRGESVTPCHLKD